MPGIQCSPDANNFRHFFVVIDGPQGTCYGGGKFKAEVLLPEDYPMTAPKVVFETKIYHPNIGTTMNNNRQLGSNMFGYIEKELVTSFTNKISITINPKFTSRAKPR